MSSTSHYYSSAIRPQKCFLALPLQNGAAIAASRYKSLSSSVNDASCQPNLTTARII